jgi:hypothetical protein
MRRRTQQAGVYRRKKQYSTRKPYKHAYMLFVHERAVTDQHHAAGGLAAHAAAHEVLRRVFLQRRQLDAP